MNDRRASRRSFLASSGVTLGGAWLGLNAPAVLAAAAEAAGRQANGTDWVNLTAGQAEALGAVADQILPPDDTPGAAEMGAVQFMDVALGGFMAGLKPVITEGLGTLDQSARETGAANFASLPFAAQTEIIAGIESTPFFARVHMLTLLGVFAMPSHGGNVDQSGWKLIGFEPRYAWQPPFGFYDAAHNEGDKDAGT